MWRHRHACGINGQKHTTVFRVSVRPTLSCVSSLPKQFFYFEFNIQNQGIKKNKVVNNKPLPKKQNTKINNEQQSVTKSIASPSPPSSLTHVHRCIGSHNATRQTLPTSAKLTYLSVCNRRDGVSENTDSPSSPSSITYVHRCIGSRNTTR